MKLDEFKAKRESLEIFVKEQIIGPGAHNKKFHFKVEIENYEESIKNKIALDDLFEVIPEVPAYQYGSAVLFPQTRPSTANNQTVTEDDQIENLDDIIENEENSSFDDDNSKQDVSDNLVSKQQNYPSQFGLTFVVDKKFNRERDLAISFKFRKYSRVKNKDCFKRGLAIYLPEYNVELKTAINEYLSEFFSVIEKNNDCFLTLSKEIKVDDFYKVDYILLNNYVKHELVKSIKDLFVNDELKEFNKKESIREFGILHEEKQINFFSLSTKNYNGQEYNEVFTIYENSIVSYIKTQLNKSLGNFSQLKSSIEKIEVYNQLKNAINDLKSVYKKQDATPVWQSKFYELAINLPAYNEKEVQRFPSEVISTDFPDLVYSVQYFTDKKDENKDKLFVKLIVTNQSKVELKEGEPPMLNKKDEANINACFGVKIIVSESKKGTLLNYNPPQLLDIDEEDNFNKLLYRKFEDFGEGYNTSVNWGVTKEGSRYIETEFLPEEETPKVDFKPSKIENGKIVSRLKDDEILSMRRLSTLSDVSDKDVIKGLNEFIDSYKFWIDEKQGDLESEVNNDLLLKQIKACNNDYNRLKRNIRLLENNNRALVAFRLMNTAMFMQLHHGIIKDRKHRSHYDLFGDLDENYYKQVETFNKNGEIEEYKWRSFQLAFVLLNVDAFVKPENVDKTVKDVFGTGWPERNEIADLVWFPTGGGKTEAYLGIIAFTIILRRFTHGEKGYGTTVLMRYTLRLLTLQQFQRATLLICALEVIRKDKYVIPNHYILGDEKISIGLFVGAASLPNKWDEMKEALQEISNQLPLHNGKKIKTSLPFTDCPWCGEDLFISSQLDNISPNHNDTYGIGNKLNICCNNKDCTFHGRPESILENTLPNIPFSLFDEDIYKYPPTLLFGTVDKFAALANKVENNSTQRNVDSRRFFGKGWAGKNINRECLPPELVIQDELHLLLGPLGTAVGLFEKAIDKLCSFTNEQNEIIKPKIITSTATTRNTDKQIFALFNRRSEIFPKQGITADDSFFAYYERDASSTYISNRKYIGVLPIGKTQVWMQLRIASVALAHRLKYIKEKLTFDQIFYQSDEYNDLKKVIDYYHTVLGYYNSLKEVGKTQSQLSHYLPGDVNYIIKNTIPWTFLDKIISEDGKINDSELTGRLNGEEVKTNLSTIDSKLELIKTESNESFLNVSYPPEFVISTNMISVGIDVSRFNTMIINSMPRNIAEYIQASSRVARDEAGIVFTVHHPFRSRDISHYQKFKEFHEKFYSYVEPISVTPFATKALDRYLAMLFATLIRHKPNFGLSNNSDAKNDIDGKRNQLVSQLMDIINEVKDNSDKLNEYLTSEDKPGNKSSVDGIISSEEVNEVKEKAEELIDNWLIRLEQTKERDSLNDFVFRNHQEILNSLFINNTDNSYPYHWKVGQSLREIDPTTVINTVQQ